MRWLPTSGQQHVEQTYPDHDVSYFTTTTPGMFRANEACNLPGALLSQCELCILHWVVQHSSENVDKAIPSHARRPYIYQVSLHLHGVLRCERMTRHNCGLLCTSEGCNCPIVGTKTTCRQSSDCSGWDKVPGKKPLVSAHTALVGSAPGLGRRVGCDE